MADQCLLTSGVTIRRFHELFLRLWWGYPYKKKRFQKKTLVAYNTKTYILHKKHWFLFITNVLFN